MSWKSCNYCKIEFKKRVNCSRKNWELTRYCSRKCCDNDKIGKLGWNKGISPSLETKQKISKTLTGRKIPREIVEKIRRRKGPENNKWKGGITPLNKMIRSSPQYKQWRISVFERDKYTCQICGAKNGKGVGRSVKLEADHIKPFSVYKDLRFSLDNGRTLCVECHRKTPTWGVNYIRYNINT